MKTKLLFTILVVGLVSMLTFSVVSASPADPFTGHWYAVDSFDGSDIRLTIAGGGAGSYRITWTENYFTLCAGEPGIGRGSGTSVSATELDVEIQFTCFTTGTTLDQVFTFTYNPVTNTLTDGTDTWSRIGAP